ncbi:hypothetical protein NHH03_17855 [Stieleria sp. TO1_6]|uniref:hypothetical protein n=1 Tax=Stieleria tagensis TaxID=2956795 RepID=UPI00209B44DB|nr:hypothetical protein [Stieleria tagensis]MCO8123615.1 hypothetical protein [Stieleria tagensis]
MSAGGFASPRDRQGLLLVCESGRRWCDAARRFVGPFQHAPTAGEPHDALWPRSLTADRSDSALGPAPLVRVQSVEGPKVRAAIAGKELVAILWQVSLGNLDAVALSVAQIGVGRPDVLQIAAIDDPLLATAAQLPLRMMELGVRAVVQDPEQFATIARLIRRRFSLDAEQQIRLLTTE